MQGLRFGVKCLGFRVLGLWLRVEGVGFWNLNCILQTLDSGFRF